MEGGEIWLTTLPQDRLGYLTRGVLSLSFVACKCYGEKAPGHYALGVESQGDLKSRSFEEDI